MKGKTTLEEQHDVLCRAVYAEDYVGHTSRHVVENLKVILVKTNLPFSKAHFLKEPLYQIVDIQK